MDLYQLILTTHILTAVSLIIVVIYSDHLGMLWMRGRKETLDPVLLQKLHHLIYCGLIVSLLTGLYMFLPSREYLLTVTAFYIKMGLVLTLWTNSFFVGKFSRIATTKPYALLTKEERVPLYVSGAVSTISWVGVIVAATQLGL